MTSLNQTFVVTPMPLYFAVSVAACCAAVDVFDEYGASIAPFLSQPLMIDSSNAADGFTVAVSAWMTATLRFCAWIAASPAYFAFWFARRWQYHLPTISACVSPPMNRS